MFNSWNLGTISGITIRVHWTFVLLPAWIYFSSLVAGSGLAAAFLSVLFVLAIFGCVLLHELGHALAARQFGIGTRDITLLPIGGVAALERMPRNPWQELWIAVAGPLVNVVIALIILIGLVIAPSVGLTVTGRFLGNLMLANIVLVVFNMIPAFPMDGGRVLRSVLAMTMDYAKATNVAATVGQACAVGLGLLGLFSGNFVLVLVAGFVYLAARAENMHVMHGANRPVQFVNQFDPATSDQATPADDDISFMDETVPASLSASSVAAWLASKKRSHCTVVDAGRIVGEVTHAQLIAAIYRGLGRIPVGQLCNS